ncbi:MAG: hypothetical protein HXS54_13130 [Theionarchaea archaeon]|nr:hypothetical protein [Theionarchaea archaeon]
MQAMSNLFYGTILEIDINSISNNEVDLSKDVAVLPFLRDLGFISCYLTGIIVFFTARRLFFCIPEAFEVILTGGTLRKRRGDVKEEIITGYNRLLREFEKLINGKYVYLPAIILFLMTIIFFIVLKEPYEERDLITWFSSNFFFGNWILTLIVSSLMWFVVGILFWKMLCIVSFMRKLNHQYTFALKPFDPDGFGGLRPFSQIWFNMTLLIIPLLLTWVVVFGHFHTFDVIYPQLQKNIDVVTSILHSIAIIALLGYPMKIYHNIVETQKAELLNNIRIKIDKSYRKIEETYLTDKERELDDNSLKKIKDYQEIVMKIRSVPSWPFTLSEKIAVLIGTAAPWAAIIGDHFN